MSNDTSNANHATEAPAKHWIKILAPYKSPDLGQSLFEIAVTIGSFILLWAIMWWSLQVSYFVTFLLAIPAAGMLVRMFLIQHDCGHGSFFRSRELNDWVGRILGVFTLTPYDYWKRTHAIHHASSGNLDRRGFGDIETLTVREYQARSPFQKTALSALSQPICLVWHRSDLSVFFAASFARRPDAPWLEPMDLYHVDQSRHYRLRRSWHVAFWRERFPDHSSPGDDHRSDNWGSGCSLFNTSLTAHIGITKAIGTVTKPLFTAHHTMICPLF